MTRFAVGLTLFVVAVLSLFAFNYVTGMTDSLHARVAAVDSL